MKASRSYALANSALAWRVEVAVRARAELRKGEAQATLQLCHANFCLFENFGPGGDRTPDLVVRSHML